MYNIPRPKGMSWMQRMRELSQTYRDPASVPGGVPMVPGTTELQKDWGSWAKAWRAYYDATAPKYQPLPPHPDGSLIFPPPGSSNEAWNEWAKSLSS